MLGIYCTILAASIACSTRLGNSPSRNVATTIIARPTDNGRDDESATDASRFVHVHGLDDHEVVIRRNRTGCHANDGQPHEAGVDRRTED